MAFLRQNQTGSLVSDAGGIAGEGSNVGVRQKTTAGSPSGWYNIQDFLSANTQAPVVQQRIEQRGSEELNKAKNELAGNVSNLTTAPTPTAYSQSALQGITEGGLSGEETQNLRNYLDQSLTGAEAGQQQYELSAKEQLPDIANPFQSLKPGSFESLMSWYGNLEKPSATYTPGMQKMDEMLLRGQKTFAQDYPEQLQSQYKEQVTAPLESKRAEVEASKAKSEEAFRQAGKQWYEGISDYLGNEKNKITDIYNQQAQQLADINSQNIWDVMGPEYSQYAQQAQASGVSPSGYTTVAQRPTIQPTAGEGVNQANLQAYRVTGLNPYDYVTRGTIYNPSMNTAAVTLSPEQFDTYNVLAGLIPNAGYEQYAEGKTFSPGEYTFNKQGFEEDYKNIARQLAENKVKADLAELGKLSPANIPTGTNPGDYPNLVQSYDVPIYAQTPFGTIELQSPQAGTKVYSPYNFVDPSMVVGNTGNQEAISSLNSSGPPQDPYGQQNQSNGENFFQSLLDSLGGLF